MSLPQPVAPNADDGLGDIVHDPRLFVPRVDMTPWWDPRLPVLGQALSQMEEHGSPATIFDGSGCTLWLDYARYTDPDGKTGVRATRHVRGTITAADLLDEQVGSESEQFLLALSQPGHSFRVRCHTRIPLNGHHGTEAMPDEARLVQMKVRIVWRGEVTVRVTAPVIPGPVTWKTNRSNVAYAATPSTPTVPSSSTPPTTRWLSTTKAGTS